MRVVLDTNILVSGLIAQGHPPALLIDAWLEHAFDLLVSPHQFEEIARVTRYPRVAKRIRRSEAGKLINLLRDLAVWVQRPARGAKRGSDR